MNATATRTVLIKEHGKAPGANDGFVANNKVSTCSPAHDERSSQANVDNNGPEDSGSGRHPLSFLHAFDDIVSNVVIPQFLIEHKATLRFPEMVRAMIKC